MESVVISQFSFLTLIICAFLFQSHQRFTNFQSFQSTNLDFVGLLYCIVCCFINFCPHSYLFQLLKR